MSRLPRVPVKLKVFSPDSVVFEGFWLRADAAEFKLGTDSLDTASLGIISASSKAYICRRTCTSIEDSREKYLAVALANDSCCCSNRELSWATPSDVADF